MIGSLTVIGLAVAAVLGYLITSAISEVIANEAMGWIPHLSRGIAERASRRLPSKSRERYLEEWCADLAQFDDRPLTALSHALLIAATVGVLSRALAPDAAIAPARTWRSTIGRFPLASVAMIRRAAVSMERIVRRTATVFARKTFFPNGYRTIEFLVIFVIFAITAVIADGAVAALLPRTSGGYAGGVSISITVGIVCVFMMNVLVGRLMTATDALFRVIRTRSARRL